MRYHAKTRYYAKKTLRVVSLQSRESFLDTFLIRGLISGSKFSEARSFHFGLVCGDLTAAAACATGRRLIVRIHHYFHRAAWALVCFLDQINQQGVGVAFRARSSRADNKTSKYVWNLEDPLVSLQPLFLFCQYHSID